MACHDRPSSGDRRAAQGGRSGTRVIGCHDVTDAGVLAGADSADRVFEVWAVRSAIEELPIEEREVVRLQHLERFTHAEIAERLGIPLGTVKSRSSRAHRRLASRLGYLRKVTG